MIISELIEKLKKISDKHGDVEVLFCDLEGSGSPYSVSRVSFEVAEADAYPEDWDMPEGFEFVELT